MSDEQENVGAGSETSGETTETVQTETAATETAQTESADAEVAVEQKAGDACVCPDGRTGMLHANEAGDGFVCIPNADQG